MASRTAKGSAFQRWICAWLKERGWEVFNIPRKSTRIYSAKLKTFIFVSSKIDIFGADIIAKKPGRSTLWIQATLHKSRRLKEEEFDKHSWNDRETPMIWMKDDKGRVFIFGALPIENSPLNFEYYGDIVRRIFSHDPEFKYEF